MNAKRVRMAASTLFLATALAACGGSSGSSGSASPDAWVKSICQAVVPFKTDITNRESALAASAGATDIPSIKAKLQTFISAVAADGNAVLGKVKAAGTPNVSNGKQIENALVNAISRMVDALNKANSQVSNLPTNSPTAFATGAQSIGTAIQGSVSGLGASLQGLKTGALDQAAKSTPECASLTAG